MKKSREKSIKKKNNQFVIIDYYLIEREKGENYRITK